MRKLFLVAGIAISLQAHAELLKPLKDTDGNSCALDSESIEIAGSKSAPIVAIGIFCHKKRQGTETYSKFSVACNSAQVVVTSHGEWDCVSNDILVNQQEKAKLGVPNETSVVGQYAEIACGYARNTKREPEPENRPRMLEMQPPAYE